MLSWPAMSGFDASVDGRPLRAVKNSGCLDCQQSAPTASAAGDVAGSPMLPAAAWYCRGGSKTNMSILGVDLDASSRRCPTRPVRSLPDRWPDTSELLVRRLSPPLFVVGPANDGMRVGEGTGTRSKSEAAARPLVPLRKPQIAVVVRPDEGIALVAQVRTRASGLRRCSRTCPTSGVGASLPAEFTQRMPAARASLTIAPMGPVPSPRSGRTSPVEWLMTFAPWALAKAAAAARSTSVSTQIRYSWASGAISWTISATAVPCSVAC